jgi:hypothetical protein
MCILDMVCKSTRKSKSKRGGNPDQTLVELIEKVLPNKYDFERMKESGIKYLQGTDYAKFVNRNKSVAKILTVENPEDATFYRSLCERIINKKLKTMDLEPCVIVPAYYAFFDDKREFVIVTPQ